MRGFPAAVAAPTITTPAFATTVPAVRTVPSRPTVRSTSTVTTRAATIATAIFSTIASMFSALTSGLTTLRALLAALTVLARVATAMVAALLAGGWLPGELLVAFRHCGFAGQTHPALFIHAETLDQNFVAELHDVFGLLHAEVGQFADVNQAIFTRQEFHKSPKILNGY